MELWIWPLFILKMLLQILIFKLFPNAYLYSRFFSSQLRKMTEKNSAQWQQMWKVIKNIEKCCQIYVQIQKNCKNYLQLKHFWWIHEKPTVHFYATPKLDIILIVTSVQDNSYILMQDTMYSAFHNKTNYQNKSLINMNSNFVILWPL